MNAPHLDIQRYYDQGRACEDRARWSEAIENYHRALTCVPSIVGVHPWFQRYLLDGSEPIDIGPEKISDIYARLGRCHCESTRWPTASLCLTAALRWNNANETARRLSALRPNLYFTPRAAPTVLASGNSANPDMLGFVRKSLSLVFITHFTDKLKINKELAPPATKLIAATFGSMLKVFGIELAACPKIICYDRPRERHDEAARYEQALSLFCREYQFGFLPWDAIGLRAILERVITQVTTPYVMIVEHDWLFQGGEIELGDLLALFNQAPWIHMIRFNQRANAIAGYDFILEGETRLPGTALLRTVAHSNNPAIMRTAKLRDEWLPLCLADPFYGPKSWPGTAFGVEEPLFKQHVQDVRNTNFEKAHDRWGVYLWGGLDASARIVHLGV